MLCKSIAMKHLIFNDFDVATLRQYIDWTPFFMTWSLVGKYPAILEHEEVGEEAKRLFKDANDLLDRIEKEKLLEARGMCAMFPANSVGDDIEVYTDEKANIRLCQQYLCHAGSQLFIAVNATFKPE